MKRKLLLALAVAVLSASCGDENGGSSTITYTDDVPSSEGSTSNSGSTDLSSLFPSTNAESVPEPGSIAALAAVSLLSALGLKRRK